VPIADVADLLGDDEKTLREHYARWVPERQARLTKILKDAFSDKPKLTAIQGGRAYGSSHVAIRLIVTSAHVRGARQHRGPSQTGRGDR